MVIQDIEKIKKGTVLSSSKIIKVDSLSGKGINPRIEWYNPENFNESFYYSKSNNILSSSLLNN